MTRCYLAVFCMYSRAGVKEKGNALWAIKIGCACTPPFPSPSSLAALILIFVLVHVYALSLRSRECFSSQHPCCPEPRGTADGQLCHKSLQLLLLWWRWWPVSRESVTKKLILPKFQMLYNIGGRRGRVRCFNPVCTCWWCLHLFLVPPFFKARLQIILTIMSQICLVFSEPHIGRLSDALQGLPGCDTAFKLDGRSHVVSVFHFSLPAATSKTRNTLESKLCCQFPIFVLLINQDTFKNALKGNRHNC